MIDCEKDCVNFGSRMCAYPKFKHHSSCINFKSKVMSEEKKEEKKIEVTYITSMITACPDKDGKVNHFQFTVVQEVETGKFRCYFDVIDPGKVKLAESND